MENKNSVSHFSLPLPPWKQPASYRLAKYEPHGRKKPPPEEDEDEYEYDRNMDNFDAESIAAGFEIVQDEEEKRGRSIKSETASPFPERRSISRGAPGSRASSVLTPSEAHQFRIAGQSTASPPPGGNFPHARPPDDGTRNRSRSTSKKQPLRRKNVEEDLARLNPPVFLPGSKRNNNLRLRHLGVLTTILHRCLLEGDYLRAGRAWGMILRDDWSGYGMDVRTEGRWAIGAEILLWRDKRRGGSGDMEEQAEADAGEKNGGGSRKKDDWFSREGFELAKEYYERLVLHYPFRRYMPDALGPLHFYPAMFGLWIGLAQEESRVKREEADEASLRREDREPEHDGYNEDVNMSLSGDDAWEERRRAHLVAEARVKELEEAQQIASRLDDLLVSPPYVDSYELLKLRGMISLWIADLYLSSVSPDEAVDRYDYEDGDVVMMSYGDPVDSVFQKMKQSRVVENKAAEVEKARRFFEMAKMKKMGPIGAVDRMYLDKVGSFFQWQ